MFADTSSCPATLGHKQDAKKTLPADSPRYPHPLCNCRWPEMEKILENSLRGAGQLNGGAAVWAIASRQNH